MPAELVTHFDPRQLLLAGAVAPAEAGTGFLRLRLKRHRWFPKTLKTRDPLIFSVGAPPRRPPGRSRASGFLGPGDN